MPMKQSHTNEKEIMNYLLHVSDYDSEEGKQMYHFGRMEAYKQESLHQDRPGKCVINNIMRYAMALDAFKTKDGHTFFILGN